MGGNILKRFHYDFDPSATLWTNIVYGVEQKPYMGPGKRCPRDELPPFHAFLERTYDLSRSVFGSSVDSAPTKKSGEEKRDLALRTFSYSPVHIILTGYHLMKFAKYSLLILANRVCALGLYIFMKVLIIYFKHIKQLKAEEMLEKYPFCCQLLCKANKELRGANKFFWDHAYKAPLNLLLTPVFS